jgi:hypothetical protein
MNTLEEVIETYGANWEWDADMLFLLTSEDSSSKAFRENLIKNAPHPVEEAYQAEKQYRCENCIEGEIPLTYDIAYETCKCCNGNWQDCQTCKPEGTGNDTEDLLASMRQW